MRCDLAQLRVQAFHAIADRLVHLDLVFSASVSSAAAVNILVVEPRRKSISGLHLRIRLDVRNAERFLIDDAVAADNRDHRAGRVLLLELGWYQLVEFTEIEPLESNVSGNQQT